MNDDRTANPYAAPVALVQPTELEVDQTRAGPVFYAVSPTKLFVMSLLTLSLYDLVFWWRHWKLRRARGQNVSVFWRTVFSPIFFFDFRTQLETEGAARGAALPGSLGAMPVLYIVSHGVSRVVDQLSENLLIGFAVTLVASVLTAAAVAIAQRAALEVNEAAGHRGPINSGASAGSILGGLFGCAVWALMLLVVLMPSGMYE